jgi:hypothetical protein
VNAAAPARPMATISSVVAMGRRMNGSEMFTRDRSLPRGKRRGCAGRGGRTRDK